MHFTYKWCFISSLNGFSTFFFFSLTSIYADRLLLLERGGETVYFGDIGPDSYVLREYFARYGAICPPNMNPAEYMLEAIGAGVQPRIGNRDWKDIWLDSPEYQKVKEEIRDMKEKALAKPHEEHKKSSTCQSLSSPSTGPAC